MKRQFRERQINRAGRSAVYNVNREIKKIETDKPPKIAVLS